MLVVGNEKGHITEIEEVGSALALLVPGEDRIERANRSPSLTVQ
jgi:hypothetical protein